MIILGLDIGSSACLFMGHTIVSFCQEERLIGLKKRVNLFPREAVKWCLEHNHISLSDVDRIAVSWDCTKYPFKMFKPLLFQKMRNRRRYSGKKPDSVRIRSANDAVEYLLANSPSTIKRSIRDNLRIMGFKGPIPEIIFVGHHLSHAYQAYHQSSFKDAAILIADGSGEENCVSAYAMKNGVLKKLFGYNIPESLGWFFSAFTAYLGFIPHKDESKMMGLAAYGNARQQGNPWIERINQILSITSDGYRIQPGYLKFGGNEYHPNYTDSLVDFITSYDEDLYPIGLGEVSRQGHKYLLEKYVDIAFAVQLQLERAAISLARRLVSISGLRNLCLAGGVFMNCKANGSVLDNSDIDNLFVPPAASDEGACIGAVFYVAEQEGVSISKIKDYNTLGPRYSNDTIIRILKNSGIRYESASDVYESTSHFIEDMKTVGYFRNGVEAGARALGNRSILANPFSKGIKDHLNTTIKYRERWRPYCPSINSEYADNVMTHRAEVPFMNIARGATQYVIDEAPDVVHVDDTIRPQTVDKKHYPNFHLLLERIGKKIGAPMVLNTSFNIRGKPIICSPYDAISTFYSTNLDKLVLEDIIVHK